MTAPRLLFLNSCSFLRVDHWRRQPLVRQVPKCTSTPPSSSPAVVVIGAGVAGLSAARDLAEAGHSVTILEASDGVGGRIRTDVVDGFLLDRGFQVFIEAYPQCKEV